MIELASALRAEVDRAAAYFRSLGETDVTRSQGTGKWVKKEILGHLIDSAANNHQRFVRAQFANPFAWPGYDQQSWVPLHRYRERPWVDLVDLWLALTGMWLRSSKPCRPRSSRRLASSAITSRPRWSGGCAITFAT